MDVKTAGEEPIVWNEAGRVPYRGHRLSFFFANRQMPGEQSAKCEHDSLDDGHAPAGTSKLLEDLGGKQDAAWQ